MIIESNKPLLDIAADSYVNPVNTIGIMGKGLALEFKLKYPKMFAKYREICERNRLKVGMVMMLDEPNEPNIYLFPTKTDWRLPSSMGYIESGLIALASLLDDTHLPYSIAVPLLGCGLGGLDESEVIKLIYKHLGSLPHTIYLSTYKPGKQ